MKDTRRVHGHRKEMINTEEETSINQAYFHPIYIIGPHGINKQKVIL